jgi:hypothetical protein
MYQHLQDQRDVGWSLQLTFCYVLEHSCTKNAYLFVFVRVYLLARPWVFACVHVYLGISNANHVLMFDRWFNPAVEEQAIDRAYRIGQRKNVFVHKMIVRSTFEERIDEMIEKKRDLTNMAIGTGESWISAMSNSELRDLFALSRTGDDDVDGGMQ